MTEPSRNPELSPEKAALRQKFFDGVFGYTTVDYTIVQPAPACPVPARPAPIVQPANDTRPGQRLNILA